MDFDCKVKIVDAMMGTGKSCAAINMINSADKSKHFVYITPYLDEVKRIKNACADKKFVEPEPNNTKLADIKKLLKSEQNIVSTHALFHHFDKEIISLCRRKGYTLIMDEVSDVVERYDMSLGDFTALKTCFADIDEPTGLLRWKGNVDQDESRYFSKEKELCMSNSLVYYGGSTLMKLFPIDVFNAFSNVYILTYMFDSQIQSYYYKYFHVPYTYLYVAGETVDTFHFVDNPEERRKPDYNYSELIHILNDNNLNSIGERQYSLSKAWYKKHSSDYEMKRLKNNILNYFTNRRKSHSELNMWTTFLEYRKKISGKGYAKGFLPLNIRASNEYRNKTSIAYPVNRYINPGVSNFFKLHGIAVDNDGFALSEMLQFIWRSAIRDGKEIWIYMPSSRMRNLLKDWIAQNSINN